MVKEKAEKPVEIVNKNLAGKEWGICAGQPLVRIRLPLLDGDESNVTPDQTVRYQFANVEGNGNDDFSFMRGREALIPRDHWLLFYNNDKRVL